MCDQKELSEFEKEQLEKFKNLEEKSNDKKNGISAERRTNRGVRKEK